MQESATTRKKFQFYKSQRLLSVIYKKLINCKVEIENEIADKVGR